MLTLTMCLFSNGHVPNCMTCAHDRVGVQDPVTHVKGGLQLCWILLCFRLDVAVANLVSTTTDAQRRLGALAAVLQTSSMHSSTSDVFIPQMLQRGSGPQNIQLLSATHTSPSLLLHQSNPCHFIFHAAPSSEADEALLGGASRDHAQHVEAHRLGQRPAAGTQHHSNEPASRYIGMAAVQYEMMQTAVLRIGACMSGRRARCNP